MEEKQRRKRFDKDYKISAVKLVLEGNQSLSSVAKDIGINSNTLQNWKKQYLKDKEESFPGKGFQTPLEAELTKLRKENARLTQERDFLKKATAYFAAHEKRNIN